MKIGITGASGFVGQSWIAEAGKKHHVVGFTRNPSKPIPGAAETREFRLHSEPNVANLDAIVHLAGESVLGLWTPKKKNAILESRVLGSRRLMESLQKLPPGDRPKTLVAASAIGIYGSRGDECVTEKSPLGTGFLAETCKDWEQETQKAEDLGLRVVRLRIGLVLGKNQGAMRLVMPVFRAGLGGQLGDGKQWMSWIRVEDVAGMIERALEDPGVSGVWNATAPEPVRNSEFTQIVAAAVHRPAIFGAPSFAMRLVLGELASILLEGQRVLPERPLETGYQFRYAALENALEGL